MKWQFDNCGLPKAKYKPIKLSPQRVDRETFRHLAEIRKNIVEFVESGRNLYICGNELGNGKTSWAIKMLQTYFHHTAEGNLWNLKGMFVPTASLLLELKDFNRTHESHYDWNNLHNVDLLILDDVVVAGLSQYDYTQLFALIDSRMLAEKSIIFTSNITSKEDLSNIIGDRLASRVWNNSEIVEIKGGDMRG
jgi:DNA replication protein DnaC